MMGSFLPFIISFAVCVNVITSSDLSSRYTYEAGENEYRTDLDTVSDTRESDGMSCFDADNMSSSDESPSANKSSSASKPPSADKSPIDNSYVQPTPLMNFHTAFALMQLWEEQRLEICNMFEATESAPPIFYAPMALNTYAEASADQKDPVTPQRPSFICKTPGKANDFHVTSQTRGDRTIFYKIVMSPGRKPPLPIIKDWVMHPEFNKSEETLKEEIIFELTNKTLQETTKNYIRKLSDLLHYKVICENFFPHVPFQSSYEPGNKLEFFPVEVYEGEILNLPLLGCHVRSPYLGENIRQFLTRLIGDLLYKIEDVTDKKRNKRLKLIMDMKW